MIEAGYRIYPNLYKFEEYGVPQARHRMIIIGIIIILKSMVIKKVMIIIKMVFMINS